ncbi:competence protein CoiA [Streptococcus sp. 20-1249]|uniref:competence protein CoiA n=1 Tax=Streptococcus hepaticus TaxID=3349163 RepID=UPI00374A7763
MLVAYDDRGSLVNLAQIVPVERRKYKCPCCGAPVRLKNGTIMRPHFAHINLADCRYFSENESTQHLELKASLYEWASKSVQVGVEVALPSIQQIADLLVEDKLALEVQCSTLPIDRLQERTQSYHKAGYQVLWLLGKDLWLKEKLTPLQKQFLYFSQNMGFHLWELEVEKKLLRLRYLIHQDLHGRVQYLTRSFPFGQGDLLDILRLPYASQKLSCFEGKINQNICHYVAQQLHYQSPKWMKKQAQAYEKGENLLLYDENDFYPQIQLPVSQDGFAQIRQELSEVYEQFQAFYQKEKNKKVQKLYPPIYYKMACKR